MHKYYNIYYLIDKFNIKELLNINIKINLIYRNYKSSNYLNEVLKIKKFCKKKGFKFFLANNIKLAKTGNAGIFAGSLELVKEGNLKIKQDNLFDDVYIPSFNKNLKYSNLQLKKGFKIIGSAHNVGEIKNKEKQKSLLNK